METIEATSSAKALYLQAAALGGVEVSSSSLDRLIDVIGPGFEKVEDSRRLEAVANLLALIGAALMWAQETGESTLNEGNVEKAREIGRATCRERA